MKTKIIALIAIISVMLISGCSTGRNGDTPITDINVYQGTDGLEIEFLKDTPPTQVYENETFPVVVLLKNKGAYDVSTGKILINYDSNDFSISGKSAQSYSFELEGKKAYDPTVHQTVKTFYLRTIPLLPLSNTLTSSVFVSTCYNYGTKLNSEVCIDTDPHNIKKIEKPCEPKDESFSGQGSPVAVTKIETRMMASETGVRPQFKIYIKNEGNGQVFGKDKTEEACSSQKITRDDINGVTIKELRFSEYTKEYMDCIPKTIRLKDGEDYFVCTMKEEFMIPSEKPTFLTNLYLEFEYGYMFTESKSIEVKKITSK